MKKRMIVMMLIAVVCIGGGYYWYSVAHQDKLIVLSGNVDIRDVDVSFRVSGRLQSLAVDEGAFVRQGQILGQLDVQPLVHALSEAESNLAALKARREMYHKGYRREDIDRAKADWTASQAVLDNARRVFVRQRELMEAGASSHQEYDNAKGAYDQALALAEAAERQYQALRRGYRPEEVAEADANVGRAEAQAAAARLQLADATLKAPSDGIILTRAVEPGTMLEAGSPVFTLSLVRPVWIRAYVDEPNLGLVAPGTRVKVCTDSRRDRPYHGVVGFVSPTAEFTPKNVETPDLRTALVYRFRVIVEDPDDALRQGMPVTIRLAD